MALPGEQWWPEDWFGGAAAPAPAAPAAAPAGPPPEPTDLLADDPSAAWQPEEWVVPEVALDLGAPPDAAAPAMPVAPGLTEEAAPPPGPDGSAPGPEGGPAAATLPQAPSAVAGPTVAPAADADQGLFPWDAPEALQDVPGAAGADVPADYDFTEEEALQADQAAQDAELEALLNGPNAGERLAARRVRQEMKSEDFVATRRLEEDRKNREWAERNHNAWQKRVAELGAERQTVRRQLGELVKGGVDNQRWYKNASTIQKLGGWISAIVGGMRSPYTGGKNTGIDFVMDLVQQDIDSQKFDLERRGQLLGQELGILGQMVAETGDVLRAEEALRLATYANIDQRLAAEAAKLDPAGTAFQRIGEERLIARQKAKAEEAAFEERAFQRKKDEHEMTMREEQLAEQRRARGAAAAQAQRSLDAGMLKDGFVRDPKAPGGYRYDPSVLPAKGLDPQDQLAALRGEKISKELTAEERERTITFRGKTIGLAKSKGEGEKLRLQQSYYDTYQKELVELRNMVTEPDGSPKTFYQGPGWKLASNPERDAIGAKARKLLYLEAKINDPDSAVREAEIEFGKDIVPFIQGLTERGVDPTAKVEELLKSADTRLDAAYDAVLEKPPEDPTTTASSVWRGARGAAKDMQKKASAATPAQQDIELSAPIAAGTPDAARAEFVRQRVAILNRWAADEPQRFEGRDVQALRAAWDADPNLAPDEKKKLRAALDGAIRKVWGKAGLPWSAGAGRPLRTDRLPPPVDMDDEDM